MVSSQIVHSLGFEGGMKYIEIRQNGRQVKRIWEDEAEFVTVAKQMIAEGKEARVLTQWVQVREGGAA